MRMGPIEHIRKHILRLSQAELAGLVGVTQPTISRWENGEHEPTRAELALIRKAVADTGAAWDDAWFFEVPTASVPGQAA